MDQIQAETYLLSQQQAKKQYPFGSEVTVFKVNNKMFATLSLGKMGKGGEKNHLDWWMNLKCDPDEAFALRDIFDSVLPGYHMNKRHWNTIILDNSIPENEIKRMIDNSYSLVVSQMSKKDQLKLVCR